MRKLLTLAVALLALLAGGCAAVSVLPLAALMGSPNAAALEIHSQTDIRLETADFMVIKPNVIGESEGFSLLGILTIVPPKFTEAMNRLFTQAEMQPGRPKPWRTWSWKKTAAISFSILCRESRFAPMSSSLCR